MIREFDKEFPDLMVFKDSPARPASPTEYDDSNYPEKLFDNMTLFLLAQQKEPDFVEGYCLRENNKIRLQAIRETITQKPKLPEKRLLSKKSAISDNSCLDHLTIVWVRI